MACTSGCATPGAHANWGECMRSKSLRVSYSNSANGQDATAQKKWDAELDLYSSACAQGIEPDTTRTSDIRRAIEISNQTGVAYGATEGT